MALSGLEIYKLLAKTNCRKCGFPTCLAFAMQLAQKKVSLDKCPYISKEAKAALDGAAEPPIRLVSFGSGGKVVEIGNETVLFRHEEKFHRPTAVGFIIEDSISKDSLHKVLTEIKKLRFERVGQKLEVDCIAVISKQENADKFLEFVDEVFRAVDLPVILINQNKEAMGKALKKYSHKKPLIGYAEEHNVDIMAAFALEYKVPLIISSENIEMLPDVVKKAVELGVKDLILYTKEKHIKRKIWDLTMIRRLALKNSFRPLGYPSMGIAQHKDPYLEGAIASSLISKYAGIVLLNNRQPWHVLSILTFRQNLYSDPQKPLQVEPKIYEVGKVNENSPVLVTTNFSLSYFTVEAEVESSKRAAYIISCDAEGMSVLTAWAAEKFTADTIAKVLKESGIEEKAKHKTVVIPGYVAVLAAALEDKSGWKVIVGPKEASGLPGFLRKMA